MGAAEELKFPPEGEKSKENSSNPDIKEEQNQTFQDIESLLKDGSWKYKLLEKQESIITFESLKEDLEKIIGPIENLEKIDILIKLLNNRDKEYLDLNIEKCLFFTLFDIFWKGEKFTYMDFMECKREITEILKDSGGSFESTVNEDYDYKVYLDRQMPRYNFNEIKKKLGIKSKDINEDLLKKLDELNSILPFSQDPGEVRGVDYTRELKEITQCNKDENGFYGFYKLLKSPNYIIRGAELNRKIEVFDINPNQKPIIIIEQLYSKINSGNEIDINEVIFYILLEKFGGEKIPTYKDFEESKKRENRKNKNNLPETYNENEFRDFFFKGISKYSIEQSAKILGMKNIDEGLLRELNTILPFLRNDIILNVNKAS